LKENGPDPVIDKHILTEEWLEKKMRSKHVPVKALLLDQANISGIGNWVGDEIMYDAKLHPEQYSDTFDSAQVKKLHASIIHICKTAVDVLGDSDKFPDEWLFKHRWGKGKKDAPGTLPDGSQITFVTVGGRTSCVVPSVQKKTGAVAGDIGSSGDVKDDVKSKKAAGKKQVKVPAAKKRKEASELKEEDASNAVPAKAQAAKRQRGGKKSISINGADKLDENSEQKPEVDSDPKTKKRKSDKNPVSENSSRTKGARGAKEEDIASETIIPAQAEGRRRSGRIVGKSV